jgi:hypothetical protein
MISRRGKASGTSLIRGLPRSLAKQVESAMARSCESVRPSVLAVLRLRVNSNLVDCMTGRLAGFSPLRILPA